MRHKAPTDPRKVEQQKSMLAQSLPINVLHIIPTLSGGGAERQIRLLAAETAALGHSVAIASKLTPDDARELRNIGVVPFPLNGRSSYDPKLIYQTVFAIRRTKADLIQTWLPQGDVLGASASWITGVPMILCERSSAKAYPKGWRNSLRKLAGKQASMIIANSQGGFDHWRGHKSRLIIPNALSEYNGSEADESTNISSPTDSPLVICVGRLAAEKNIEQIILSMQYLSHLTVRLFIIGSGPEEFRLKNIAIAAGYAERVVFLGHQPDVRRWLAKASLLVSASTFEGHPNAVLEAAQVGTPLLLSNIPEHHDAVGEGACYFPLGDPQSLANLTDALLSNRSAAEARAAIARSKVNNLTVAKVTGAYLAAYRSICDRSDVL